MRSPRFPILTSTTLSLVFLAVPRSAAYGPVAPFTQISGREYLTIESATNMAEVVARGTIIEKISHGFRLRVSEILKGPAIETLDLYWNNGVGPSWSTDISPQQLRVGTEVLVFTNRQPFESAPHAVRSIVRARATTMPAQETALFVTFISPIPLDGSARVYTIDIDRPPRSNRDEILDVAHASLRSPCSDWIEGILPDGSSVLLPRFPNLQTVIRRLSLSKDPKERYNAARMLNYFKSDENLPFLKNLLADPYMGSIYGAGKWKTADFPIRAQAWFAYRWWVAPDTQWESLPPPNPPIIGPALTYASPPFAHWKGLLLVAPFFWCLIALPICYRQHTKKKSSTCSVYPVSLRFFIATTSLLLALATLTLWISSYRHVREIMFAQSGRHYEIASYRGAIHSLILADWTGPSDDLYGSFDVATTEDCWSPQFLKPPHLWQQAGLAFATGDTAPGPTSLYRYTAIVIPYYLPLMIFLFLPALQIRRLCIMYLRRHRSLCLHCGYDLRATPARCPECGHATTNYQSPTTHNAAPAALSVH